MSKAYNIIEALNSENGTEFSFGGGKRKCYVDGDGQGRLKLMEVDLNNPIAADSELPLNDYIVNQKFFKIARPVTFEEVKKSVDGNVNIKVNLDYGEGMINGDEYHTFRWIIESLIYKTSNDEEFISKITKGKWYIKEED